MTKSTALVSPLKTTHTHTVVFLQKMKYLGSGHPTTLSTKKALNKGQRATNALVLENDKCKFLSGHKTANNHGLIAKNWFTITTKPRGTKGSFGAGKKLIEQKSSHETSCSG